MPASSLKKIKTKTFHLKANYFRTTFFSQKTSLGARWLKMDFLGPGYPNRPCRNESRVPIGFRRSCEMLGFLYDYRGGLRRNQIMSAYSLQT